MGQQENVQASDVFGTQIHFSASLSLLHKQMRASRTFLSVVAHSVFLLSYAVSYKPWLLSCSTPEAVRPDRGQFTVPSHHGRQAGSELLTAHAVDVGPRSVAAPVQLWQQCLLRKPRA